MKVNAEDNIKKIDNYKCKTNSTQWGFDWYFVLIINHKSDTNNYIWCLILISYKYIAMKPWHLMAHL